MAQMLYLFVDHKLIEGYFHLKKPEHTLDQTGMGKFAQ
jgi:hypothetical protein